MSPNALYFLTGFFCFLYLGPCLEKPTQVIHQICLNIKTDLINFALFLLLGGRRPYFEGNTPPLPSYVCPLVSFNVIYLFRSFEEKMPESDGAVGRGAALS